MRRWTLLICLLLVVFMGAAQAVHFHANEFSNHENCVVCQVAHAPSAAGPVLLLTVVLVVAAFVSPVSIPPPRLSLHAFSLFSRPPPIA
jgi:uncharacterized membrane protein YdjX (TVP38/TMEM64 family)